MARIQDLVKTHKLLNDPRAPPWSVKFVAIAGSAIALGASFVLLFWAGPTDPGSLAASAAHAEAPADAGGDAPEPQGPAAGNDSASTSVVPTLDLPS